MLRAAGLGLLVAALATAACSSDPEKAEETAKKQPPALGDADFDPHAGEQTGATAHYDVAGTGWHAMPFPSDTRRAADGSLDLTGFPEPRTGKLVSLIDKFIALGKNLDGWSLQPTIFIRFDGRLTSKRLPSVPETLTQASMFLVDVTPGGAHRGELFPLRSKLSPTTRGNLLEPNMLMVQPTWGTPLRPKTTYAFILRRGVKDYDDKVLGRPVPLGRIIDTATGVLDKDAVPLDEHENKLAAALKPLTDILANKDDKTVDVPPMDIAAATVFTTSDPVAPLRALAEYVRTQTKRELATGWVTASKKKFSSYTLLRGTYKGPNFQAGTKPYWSAGGNFAFGADGKPVIQETEELRVAIAVPDDRSQDFGDGLPVVIYSHGTGGKFDGFADGGKLEVAEQLTKQGLMVVGIDQPLHGPRSGAKALSDTEVQLASFNFLNPDAGRTTFRQAALDNVFLLEMLREGKLNIPGLLAPNQQAVVADDNRMLFMGHSQGALVGVLLASVEANFRAFMFSGGGGGLSLTAVMRKDVVDFPAIINAALNLDEGELSEYHPGIALIQTLVDITDPLAYGREVFQRPADKRPPHVLMTEGFKDQASLYPTAEALAASMGLAILKPSVHLSQAAVALQLPVMPLPVANNLTFGAHKATGLLVQYASGDHFVIFKDELAAKMYADFMFSVASTGEAMIQ